MPAADKYDDLYTLACCIRTQTIALLDEDPILHVPENGGITHAGEGFCCDSLWVKLLDPVIPLPANAQQRDCATSVTERFEIVLGLNACTEKLFFEGDCTEDIEAECPEGEDGCFEVNHAIGSDDCEGETPSVAEETAYIWRARSLLRRELACRIQCCADGPAGQCCVPIRCRSVRVAEIITTTEGGCSYLSVIVEAQL